MRAILTIALAACLWPLSAAQAERHKAKLETAHRVAPPYQDYDVAPRLISGRAPLYPVSKLVQGGDGYALISFVIDIDGSTRDFEVTRADHDVFGAHAIIAARQWKFTPALQDGERVAVRVQQPFEFQAGARRRENND